VGVIVCAYRVSLRNLLYTTVSIVALAATSAEVRGADLRYPANADPPAIVAFPRQCQWWGEGGWLDESGRGTVLGAAGRLGTKSGWDAALGFDCRFGPSPWHVSAQARYGHDSNSPARDVVGRFLVPNGAGTAIVPLNIPGTATINNRENHALADFAVGRDVGLGLGQSQVKVGLRIAEISANTSASGVFFVPSTTGVGAVKSPQAFGLQQSSRFAGVGPRVGLEGAVPLGGPWSFDYLAGTALLFGRTSLSVSGAESIGAASFGASSEVAVFNLDAQAGVSYWFSQTMKLTASYRFDGYWGALKTVNANGSVANSDRFFTGPMLRLTVATN
jgi:hypothetical protein